MPPEGSPEIPKRDFVDSRNSRKSREPSPDVESPKETLREDATVDSEREVLKVRERPESSERKKPMKKRKRPRQRSVEPRDKKPKTPEDLADSSSPQGSAVPAENGVSSGSEEASSPGQPPEEAAATPQEAFLGSTLSHHRDIAGEDASDTDTRKEALFEESMETDVSLDSAVKAEGTPQEERSTVKSEPEAETGEMASIRSDSYSSPESEEGISDAKPEVLTKKDETLPETVESPKAGISDVPNGTGTQPEAPDSEALDEDRPPMRYDRNVLLTLDYHKSPSNNI